MDHLTITRFDTELPLMYADQLQRLFERNYPPSHSVEERRADHARRRGGLALQSTLYTASREDTLLAFLESQIVEREEYTYEQLSWFMTDRPARHLGLARLLHEHFIHDASNRAYARQPAKTRVVLKVDRYNPALSMYRRWGYAALYEDENSKLTMTKELPE